MHPFPHLYHVSASAQAAGSVTLASPGLANLPSNAPQEFDGPGDLWSPETLLTAALADCFVLSFRAVAGASKFAWSALECQAEGRLERIERVTQFTGFSLAVKLTVPPGTDLERAHKLLEKAEQVCLISASLKGERELKLEIVNG
jgi:organic hydroperoxide reductase OsmC/OhrA